LSSSFFSSLSLALVLIFLARTSAEEIVDPEEMVPLVDSEGVENGMIRCCRTGSGMYRSLKCILRRAALLTIQPLLRPREDEPGMKLRPYRRQVSMMMIATVSATRIFATPNRCRIGSRTGMHVPTDRLPVAMETLRVFSEPLRESRHATPRPATPTTPMSSVLLTHSYELQQTSRSTLYTPPSIQYMLYMYICVSILYVEWLQPGPGPGPLSTH
jgi:hypothetical protein